MPPKPIARNTLFYGDNLSILREYIPTESIDLVYLDPPFNSNRSYNVLFKDESGLSSEAQLTAFDDTWHWGNTAENAYYDLITNAPLGISKLIGAMREFIGENQMMAYLVMMTIRLVELHRVLKPTGSLYLHCDPTASHYLKLLLDTIFGFENYRNEIIWKRTSSHSDAKKFAKISDTIFYYTKSNKYTWNNLRLDYNEEYLNKYYGNTDKDGRRYTYADLTKPKGSTGYFYDLLGCKPPPNGWRMPQETAQKWLDEGKIEIPPTGATPRYKRFIDELKGVVISNIWSDIPPVNSQAKDALGFPTQKPIELLERIINVSSQPGDLILDPFSGCGTAIAAAQKTGRKWVGIDITHLAIAMHKSRLMDMFNIEPLKDYDVIGEPEDITAARQLARDDRYQFQWWALSLVKAKPVGGEEGSKRGRKGSDKGIDGIITFIGETERNLQNVIVQVKSGKIKSGDIRDLIGTVDNQKAAFGIFITLEEPTPDMVTEAVKAGYYVSNLWQQKYPKIQILTINALLSGTTIQMPPSNLGAFKQAPRAEKDEAKQPGLGL